ncbi:hypothetical protein L1285_08840 [Pseudoalteromonas sp. DL2-H2.2]|uniref:hypothetical protein n=1 Tax=Pseudoalteromonas sp. DL2-H2.2 TaxID=2908889 RepID=UPI001F47C67D|nr:hypothetical protein [Pseudoalteromonas sp. DL2-H2.2]MCF2908428.1 hypothetical protein [Pseudoalteromonas sp. DL2-H2.2]
MKLKKVKLKNLSPAVHSLHNANTPHIAGGAGGWSNLNRCYTDVGDICKFPKTVKRCMPMESDNSRCPECDDMM